jgi:restriction endonuclease
MTGSTLLQIFLYANVFIIGALTTIGVQHAYAHFRPKSRRSERPQSVPEVRLTEEMREQLLRKSQANYQAVLEKSAADLHRDLDETGELLNKTLNKLGTTMVGNELERYHADLEQIRKQAEAAINGAQTELSAHQTELKAAMTAAVEAEKQAALKQVAAEQEQLAKMIDTKLGDAVASFLTETLQHNVDLGAQQTYMMAMLEEHKDDFKQAAKS